MSRNPVFDYTSFCLTGFKKTFPILSKSDPVVCANWLYETAFSFSGRDGHSLTGGAEDDIRCLVAAAANIELTVYAARSIKNGLRTRLRRAWEANDHVAIFTVAFGFERAASMAIVDLRDVTWADPYRIIVDEDKEGLEMPEAVEEWVEVLCEPSIALSVTGNHSRNRKRRKPLKRAIDSLFQGIL